MLGIVKGSNNGLLGLQPARRGGERRKGDLLRSKVIILFLGFGLISGKTFHMDTLP